MYTYSYQQLAWFRRILALYLFIHFLRLIPYANEVFSEFVDHDETSFRFSMINYQFVTISATIASILFGLNIWSRVSAMCLYLVWSSFLWQNLFISNPGMAYVGWLLLIMASVPSLPKHAREAIPKRVFWAAWILMALGYTLSGIHKLQCQSWRDGTALRWVLEGPLGRTNWITKLMLYMAPDFILKIMTWMTLAGEVLFLPLGIFHHTRKWFWLFFVFVHLGILCTVRFADLTFGVLMIHLFTFDVRWVKPYVDYIIDARDAYLVNWWNSLVDGDLYKSNL